MSDQAKKTLVQEIIAKAKEFGADLAGVARVEDLKKSPSHLVSEIMPKFDDVEAKEVGSRVHGRIDWPKGAKSALVISVAHPEEKPELDWWILGEKSAAGNTPGNRILMDITKKLAAWVEEEKGIHCFKIPYHIERGGIYMKDTAALAGLGCVGKNNILITPQFGPRHRMRIVLFDIELPPTGPANFDPCADCHRPCRDACPVSAFAEKIYDEKEYDLDFLPGRTGVYSRPLCSGVMEEANANYELVEVEGQEKPGKLSKPCRQCEFACPVGKN